MVGNSGEVAYSPKERVGGRRRWRAGPAVVRALAYCGTFNGALLLLSVAALVLLSIYAQHVHGLAAVAAILGTAGAAGVAGALLGVLFGVPRSTAGTVDGPVVPGISPNTNLEQVSDWLTKLILGATLTQLASLRRDIGALCGLVAPGLGGGAEAPVVAGATILFFAVVGFLFGWFFARLRLGVAMTQADAAVALGRRAERAEQSGDHDTAQNLREVAKSVAPVLSDSDAGNELANISLRYETLRSSSPPGSARTQQMDRLVGSVRRIARSLAIERAELVSLFRTGSDGDRIVALGAMQANPALVDFECALDAIAQPRSAFEQFHALLVAREVLHQLTAAQRRRLIAVLRTPSVTSYWAGDTSRSAVADDILSQVSHP